MEGQELKEERQAKGFSQRTLAKTSGVPQRDISRIEGGRKKASEGQAKRLAEALK